MKLLFVAGYTPSFKFHQAIAALTAFIKEHSDHQVELLNINAKVRPYTFQHQIEQLNPDVIAFSIMSTYWESAKLLISHARKISDSPIICGGYHPTLAPETVIADPNIDVICRGEGEYPLLEYLNALENGEDYSHIPNLWVKIDGEIIKNDLRPLIDDLDSLPFWDRDLFNYDEWLGKTTTSIYDFYNPERIITIASGRGCHFNCSYCCNDSLRQLYHQKGPFIRQRSVDNLIKELRMLKKRFNPDYFSMEEELFATDTDWLEEFVEKYTREIDVPYRISYRVELANEHNIQLLANSGCETISYGVECGNEQYRKEYLNRLMSNDQIIKAFQLTKSYGIRALSFNMIALPFETYDNIQETIELNRQLKADFLQWFIYQPFPGTKLYDICRDNDLLKPESRVGCYVSKEPRIKMPNISPDDFKKCVSDFMKLQDELQGKHWGQIASSELPPVADIREYRDGDEYQILDLFNRVFKENRSMEHWRWEYLENPAGTTISVAVNSNDEIIAFYAGLPNWTKYKDHNGLTTQIVDSMVAPEYRKTLKKTGIFAKCLAHNGDTFLVDRFYYAFGFPNRVHYRLGTTQHVKFPYKLIRKVDKLVKNLADQSISLTAQLKKRWDKLIYQVKPIEQFDDQADRLWEKCKSDFPLAIIRNAEYLNWRYIDCPDVNYLCMGVYHKKTDELQGWAVLRLDWLTPGTTALVDWLVPRENTRVMQILLRNIEHSARVGDTTNMEAWFPPYSAEYKFLQDNGYTEQKTKSVLVAHIFMPGAIDYQFMNTKWYYTMGDSDVY